MARSFCLFLFGVVFACWITFTAACTASSDNKAHDNIIRDNDTHSNMVSNHSRDNDSRGDDRHVATDVSTYEKELSKMDQNTKQSVDAIRIKVNQVGYLPEAAKLAIREGRDEVRTFRVIDVQTERAVLEGDIPIAQFDAHSGEWVSTIDFTSLQTNGEYYIETEDGGRSHRFRIGADVYESVFVDAIRSYTLGRSATAIDDPITGLRHEGGHYQDAEARIDPEHPAGNQGEVIDVSGGWYDAGDYGKYIPPAATSVAQLLLSYELYPHAYRPGQLSFPLGLAEENHSTWPDLLQEVKFELDWMLKMQRADGAVYHKVSGMHWPGMILPEEDTQPRYVFGLSTYGTAMFAGATAMAARIYEPWDAQYAAVLLEHAERAQSYLERNPNSQFLKSAHQDDGSGGYEKSGDRGERFWAAAELLKTTGEKRYADYLEKHFSAQFQQAAESISWISGLSLGQFAYATSEAGHPERQAELRSRFAEAADAIVRRVENNGYYYSLHADEYTWASAKNGMAKAQLLLLANELEADPVYEKTALEQLHYTLGRNVNGTTYLTGAGHVMPMNPHHRMKESTGVYIPGLLVGGPNKFGGDPVLDQLLRDESPPPAKAYIDHVGSYATNEYAIDYNAPLVFVLAYFVP